VARGESRYRQSQFQQDYTFLSDARFLCKVRRRGCLSVVPSPSHPSLFSFTALSRRHATSLNPQYNFIFTLVQTLPPQPPPPFPGPRLSAVSSSSRCRLATNSYSTFWLSPFRSPGPTSSSRPSVNGDRWESSPFWVPLTTCVALSGPRCQRCAMSPQS
jgi:hypothetical protein